MIQNLKLNKILWSIVALLSLFVAVLGLFNNGIYNNLMPQGFIAAQFAQDILTILVGISLIILIIRTKEKSVKIPIVILGITGSLAYLYAIFSIERIYNLLYLFYLAILGTSFYSMVYTIASIKNEVLKKIDLSKAVRITTSVFSIVIGALFSILWISALLPLMKTGNRIEFLYSIYLLDLVFIMPAFFITGIMSLRKNPLGYVLTPAMFILGIFVIFPLGLGELAKPLFGLPVDVPSMVMSFVLTGLFLSFAVLQLIKLKVK